MPLALPYSLDIASICIVRPIARTAAGPLLQHLIKSILSRLAYATWCSAVTASFCSNSLFEILCSSYSRWFLSICTARSTGQVEPQVAVVAHLRLRWHRYRRVHLLVRIVPTDPFPYQVPYPLGVRISEFETVSLNVCIPPDAFPLPARVDLTGPTQRNWTWGSNKQEATATNAHLQMPDTHKISVRNGHGQSFWPAGGQRSSTWASLLAGKYFTRTLPVPLPSLVPATDIVPIQSQG
jgi:hypothetical protein